VFAFVRSVLPSASAPAPAATDPTAPSRAWRLRAAAAVGLVATAFVIVLYARQTRAVVSDWDATWVAARALLRGESPYAAIHVPPWPWHLNYPLPAVLLSLPFAALPLPLARGLFVGVGAAIFTYVATRRHRWPLYFVISGAMLWSWIPVQWGRSSSRPRSRRRWAGCWSRSRRLDLRCGSRIRGGRRRSEASPFSGHAS